MQGAGGCTPPPSPGTRGEGRGEGDLERKKSLENPTGLVVGLMIVSDDYDQFKALLDRAAPIYPENPTLFDDPADWE